MDESQSDTNSSSQDELVNKERFIRWQRLALDQLGFTLNFILTLTITALGYILSLLRGVCAVCEKKFSEHTIEMHRACAKKQQKHKSST